MNITYISCSCIELLILLKSTKTWEGLGGLANGPGKVGGGVEGKNAHFLEDLFGMAFNSLTILV